MPDFSGLGATAYETAGADTAASTGTTVTGSASADTKGSYAELIASTAYPTSWIYVVINTPSAADGYLVDIAVGAGGSEQVILANLGFNVASATNNTGSSYLFPVSIPAGTRLSARCQSGAGGSDTIVVAAYLSSGSMMSPSGMGVVTTYGATTATTLGTAVDPGGTANTKGSYVEFSASTQYPIKWLSASFASDDSSWAAAQHFLVDIAVGAAASEQVIISNIFLFGVTSNDRMTPSTISLPVSIPAGSRLSARCQCSVNTASDRVLNMILYGVS